MTTKIEVREETAVKLQSLADGLQLSLDEYLARIAGLFAFPQTNGHAKVVEEKTPIELVEDLIGSVDSSLPVDPNSPPHRPPMYFVVAEKLKKQGLKTP